MVYHLSPALLCLSFAVLAATEPVFAQTEQVGDTETVPLAAPAVPRLDVLSLLEEEIAGLEADVADLMAQRAAERVALDRARQEADTLQVQIETLTLAKEAASVTLTALSNQQKRLKAEIEGAYTTNPDLDGLEPGTADDSTLKVERNALELQIDELQRARELIQKVDELRNAAGVAEVESGVESRLGEGAALADEQAASLAILDALDKEREIAEVQLSGANALVATAKTELTDLSEAVEARRADLANLSAEGVAAQEALEGVQAAEAEVLARLEQRRSELETLELQLEERSARLVASTAQVDAAQSTLDDLTVQRDATQVALVEAKAALESAVADRADAENEHVALAKELTRLGEAITEAQATVTRTDADLVEAEARLATLQVESDEERLRLDDLRAERTELEQQIESQRGEILALEDTVEAIRAEHQAALMALQSDVPAALTALTEASKEAAALGNETESASGVTPPNGRVATVRADGRDLATRPTTLDAEGAKLDQSPLLPVDDVANAEERAGAPETAPAAVSDAAASETPVQAPARAPVERTAERVAQALRSAPGLPSRGSAAMRQLSDLLNAGACPTDALRETFGTINRQTLVALVRVLGACGG